MARPAIDAILCACGCGEEVRIARYPSQQRRFINGHQHKGKNNGNWRGGKADVVCPVCGDTFKAWLSQNPVTCGKDTCYRMWQRLTTSARGQNKVVVQCDHCGRDLRRFPSQVNEHNFCNRFCHSQHHSALISGVNNGRWKGGRVTYLQRQTKIRDGYRCVVCGFDLVTEVHHVTPKSEGGGDDFGNLLTLCPNHHRMAHVGIIDLESLRNTKWKPSDTAHEDSAASTTYRADSYPPASQAIQLAQCG